MCGVITFVAICVIFMIATIIVTDGENDGHVSFELSPKEQYLFCNSRKINLEYSSSNIRVYESTDGVPEISNETRQITMAWAGQLYNSYTYKSFFMAPGSCINAQKTDTSGSTNFIVIKGWSNMNKLINDEYYSYIYKNSKSSFEICSDEFEEYFVVVDSLHSAIYTAQINVVLKTYETDDLVEKCTSTTDGCTLNEEENFDFCVVIDYEGDGHSYKNEEVYIDSEDYNISIGAIIGVVIVAVVGVVIIVASIVVFVKKARSSRALEQSYTQMSNAQIESIPDTVNYTNDPQSDVPTAIITTPTYTPPGSTYPAAPAPAGTSTSDTKYSDSGLFKPVNSGSYSSY